MTGYLNPSWVRASWEGAKVSRLTLDWPSFGETGIDVEIKTDLAALRTRATEQTQNNPWAKNFLRLLRDNVVGANGPRLQAVYRNREGDRVPTIGDAVEASWREFGKYGIPTVSKNTTIKQLLRDAIQAPAREGEFILRIHRDYPGNAFGFALEVIDPRLLPSGLNGRHNGEDVTMGVAKDSYGAAVAYYFTAESSPASEVRIKGSKYTRVPAEDIFHLFLPEWIGQTRGVPWLATGIVDAKMLLGGREAELVASRLSASKMGFFSPKGPSTYKGQGETDTGKIISTVDPGSFEILPADVEFTPFDPQHPNGNYGEFETRILKGQACGWGVTYSSMSGDYSEQNYSSLRQANLEARETWKTLQDWFIDFLVRRIFDAWLDYCLPRGLILGPSGRPLPARIAQRLTVGFQGVRWEWVDPVKESRAQQVDLENMTRSASEIIRSRGGDPETVFEERAEELRAEARLQVEIAEITANE